MSFPQFLDRFYHEIIWLSIALEAVPARFPVEALPGLPVAVYGLGRDLPTANCYFPKSQAHLPPSSPRGIFYALGGGRGILSGRGFTSPLPDLMVGIPLPQRREGTSRSEWGGWRTRRTTRTTGPRCWLIFRRYEDAPARLAVGGLARRATARGLRRGYRPVSAPTASFWGGYIFEQGDLRLSSGNTPQKTEFCIDFVQFYAGFCAPFCSRGRVRPGLSRPKRRDPPSPRSGQASQ